MLEEMCKFCSKLWIDMSMRDFRCQGIGDDKLVPIENVYVKPRWCPGYTQREPFGVTMDMIMSCKLRSGEAFVEGFNFGKEK